MPTAHWLNGRSPPWVWSWTPPYPPVKLFAKCCIMPYWTTILEFKLSSAAQVHGCFGTEIYLNGGQICEKVFFVTKWSRDRAWYHTWNNVLLTANLEDGSFLSRVVDLNATAVKIAVVSFPPSSLSSLHWCVGSVLSGHATRDRIVSHHLHRPAKTSTPTNLMQFSVFLWR